MALLYNEEEYTWKVKRPLSGSHIGIRILLPQIQTPMGSGYVPLLDRSRIAQICQDAVAEHIIPESKYTDADAGQCCFYLNGTDLATQEKVLRYLILNGLIPETVYGRLDNIPFELEKWTGRASTVLFCLDHFMNLYTGEFII